MHIKFPAKMERLLQYLKLKMLPNTLFFRTMLLIFIPLIIVQVVSVVAFWHGNWERVGRKLSDNLSGNIAMAIELTTSNPDTLEEIQNLYQSNYGIKFDLITEDEQKLNIKTNTHYGKDYKLVTGLLENSLHNGCWS